MVEIEQLLRPGAPFFLIAGPCLLEDEELNLRVAETIARTAERLSIPAVFKASFDKANRSSISSPRGPGLERGLELLAQVRAETGLLVTTDIHEIAQAMPVAEVVDLLQIPAFLCRQTDLVLAAAETGKAINLKKGQWMAPGDMASQVEKARGGGAQSVAVTERGSAFGYHNLVVDMRSFALMQESCACPAIFDASHSVQLPAGAGRRAGASRATYTPWRQRRRRPARMVCSSKYIRSRPGPRLMVRACCRSPSCLACWNASWPYDGR